jgi:beta-glucanase (GH16 family)
MPRAGSADTRLDMPQAESAERDGSPKDDSSPSRRKPAKRSGSMRGALMVSGVLSVVLVFAVGLVALAATRGSSNGNEASDGTQASNVIKPTPGATASATATGSAKAKAKKKASPKPTASHKPTKTAASSHKAASSLLTVPAGWKLTFDPSFSGTQLSSTWSTCYDWVSNPSVGCTNNPTDEKEWYVPSQVNVSGGTVNLVAKQETTQGVDTSGAAKTYTCRSGMISSKPGFNFTYGLIQISAKLPYGPGLWPALWLAATNDQWPPELDIMEHWYSEPQMKVYDHTVGKSYIGGPVPTPANLSAGFHTYSLLWTKDRVTWYLDGVQVYTTTDHVPQQEMYFIANVADDSTATGACTGTMQIQSVKVYQP